MNSYKIVGGFHISCNSLAFKRRWNNDIKILMQSTDRENNNKIKIMKQNLCLIEDIIE